MMPRSRLLVLLVALLSFGAVEVHSGEVETAVLDQAAKSVYLLNGLGEHGRYACSAFLVADERVLTAQHCVGQDMRIAGLVAELISGDEYYDLALLSAPVHGTALAFRDVPVVRFEQLAALGHAYGWQRILTLHVRVYYVDLTPDKGMRPGILVKPGYIGGMSGGPIVDRDGLVVGVVQASNHDLGYGVGVRLIRAFLVGLE